MGLLVNSATLPCGVTLSNVYMTFSDFPVYLMPKGNGQYIARGTYSVYSSQERRSARETSVDVNFIVKDVTPSLHVILYNQLRLEYPDSINIL